MLYSLRSRLMAAFSILLIVPFTALVYLLTEESSKSIQESIENSTSQTMEQYASHVSTLLSQISDAGNQALSSKITQEWLTDRRNGESTPADVLLAKRRVAEFFSSFAINNSNGISIGAFASDTGGIWTQDQTYAEQEWYRRFRENDVKWTNAHRDPEQSDVSMRGREINSYVLPMAHLQSLTSDGVLKINYPTSLLRDPIEKIHFGQTGRVLLLDRQGNSVLRQSMLGEEDVLADAMAQIQNEREYRPDGVFSVRQSGVDHLVFYRVLPEQDWILIGVVPEEELYVKIRQIRNTMLLVSGLLLVLAIVAAFGLSKGITRPLSFMARAMRQVQRGDFDQALRQLPAVKAGHSEVGFVTGAFEQMTHRLKHLIETEFETNLRRKNAEYKALLLQINPHFYYNTLEIISGLAAMKREELVMDATEALGKMMRYSLDLDSDLVRVYEEFGYIRDYLFILKLRYDDRLLVTIEEEAAAGELPIPKFILQPLVENAVKYSMEDDEPAEVFLSSAISGQRLHLKVADNGTGMSPELVRDLLKDTESRDTLHILNSKGDSIGLRNVLARCRLHYGEAFQVVIDSAPGQGTAITLILPAHRS